MFKLFFFLLLALPAASLHAQSIEDPEWTTRWDGTAPDRGVVVRSAVGPGGELYIAGQEWIGSTSATGVAKWDGTSWTSLGDAVPSGINAIMVDDEGGVIVGGQIGTIGGVTVRNVARWDGTKWSPMGSGLTGIVHGLAQNRDGIFAVGEFTNAGSLKVNYVARWDKDSGWVAVGTGANKAVTTIAAFDTTLYIGGSFTSVNGVAAPYIARYESGVWKPVVGGSISFSSSPYQLAATRDGLYLRNANDTYFWNRDRWRHFDSGAVNARKGRINTITAHPDGGLVCGTIHDGWSHQNDHPAFLAERWDGTRWSQIDDGSGFGFNGSVVDFEFSGSSIYMIGAFGHAGRTFSPAVTRWDGTSFHALGDRSIGGTYAYVGSIAVAHGKTYVAGDFVVSDGYQIENLAAWDGVHWSGLAGSPNRRVWSLDADGDDLYVAGDFSRVGATTAWYVARWNGTRWDTLPSAAETGDEVRHVRAENGKVFISTTYWNTSGGGYDHAVYRLDGDKWTPLAQNIDWNVHDMLIDGDDLLICGAFMRIDKDSIEGIARWRASTGKWEGVGGGVNINDDRTISALALLRRDDGLYLGGKFAEVGGTSVLNVARWDGSAWHAVGSIGNINNGGVWGLAEHQGRLVAVGTFLEVAGDSASGIAWWDGASWRPFGAGAGSKYGRPRVEVAATGADGGLWIGGEFHAAGNKPARSVASWNGILSAVESPAASISHAVTLDAIVPNPATEAIDLSFTLSRPMHVTIELVDVLGSVVMRSVEGSRSAGRHALRTAIGDLPAGSYLLLLRAGDETVARRLGVGE